jgi:hypothetical protein
MARHSVALLERELLYAKNRATALAAPPTSIKPTTDPRPKTLYGYNSVLITRAGVGELVRIQVPDHSVTFFTLAALGLIDKAVTAFDSAIPTPRHFQPAKVHLVRGASTPTVVTAKNSKRPYKKYTAIATGAAQSSYSAPISKASGVTAAIQEAAVGAIATAKLVDTGVYGRVWFTPEYFAESK